MTIGEGRAAALHGPWPDPDEQQLAAIKAAFPEYAVWRAMAEDRSPTDWCARHHDSGSEFTAATARDLVAALSAHRGEA